MAFGGVALKSVSLFLRAIEFCCAAIILGIFSYFLATLVNHDLHVATYIRAVEGISGAAVVYTLFALVLVCCLGGIAFFSILGMLLDVAFMGAFIYVAWALRGGAHSCSGNVNTPFGSGDTRVNNAVDRGSNGITILPSLSTACRLEKAAFSVAIVAIVFFLFSIPIELLLIKHRRKERAFGPSPNNGYTAGSPKRKFWQRKPKRDNAYVEKNPDTLPVHSTPADVRNSYNTDATAVGGEPPINKYGHTAPANASYTGQQGGLVGNGYQTTTTTHQPYNQHATNGTF